MNGSNDDNASLGSLSPEDLGRLPEKPQEGAAAASPGKSQAMYHSFLSRLATEHESCCENITVVMDNAHVPLNGDFLASNGEDGGRFWQSLSGMNQMDFPPPFLLGNASLSPETPSRWDSVEGQRHGMVESDFGISYPSRTRDDSIDYEIKPPPPPSSSPTRLSPRPTTSLDSATRRMRKLQPPLRRVGNKSSEKGVVVDRPGISPVSSSDDSGYDSEPSSKEEEEEPKTIPTSTLPDKLKEGPELDAAATSRSRGSLPTSLVEKFPFATAPFEALQIDGLRPSERRNLAAVVVSEEAQSILDIGASTSGESSSLEHTS